METQEMQKLYVSMENRLKTTETKFRRYLYPHIDWRDSLICIKGARGTGKTTMLLQRYIDEFKSKGSEDALYVSADDLWFTTHTLKDVADYLHTHGISHLFIDEIHHAEEWQRMVKNIADEYADLHVVYSGSSLLKLERAKADLSRRQAVYELHGMSFREYLKFEGALDVPPLKLEEILTRHRDFALDITSRIKVLPHFARYLRTGFYPFYKTVFGQYEQRLLDIVNQILESDYPAVEEVTPATIRKTKRMLMILAASCPQLPQMNRLYAELKTNRAHGLGMLNILERARLLQLLSSEKASLKNLSRPDKIYPDNPNMMYALVNSVNMGTLRECFFMNQLRGAGHVVTYPPQGDFIVDGLYLFEVGGAGKGFDQIRDTPDSFVANDDIETGFGNKIPLWLFGFMY